MKKLIKIKIINIVTILMVFIFYLTFKKRLYNSLDPNNDKNILMIWFLIFFATLSFGSIIPLLINLFIKSNRLFIKNQRIGIILYFIFITIIDLYALLSKSSLIVYFLIALLNILCYVLYRNNDIIED